MGGLAEWLARSPCMRRGPARNDDMTRRGPYVKTFSQLHLACLDQESHARTCGYWYLISANGCSCTAFAQRESLFRWAEERGLTLPGDIPAPGNRAFFSIDGAYRDALHLDEQAFYALEGERTRGLQNGDWTLAIVTTDEDGLRTVHKLNPNVKDRPIYDASESRAMLG